MAKIKVLQVVGALRTGGLETVAMNFFRYADREKYEFHFLSYQEEKGDYEDEITELGGKIIKILPPNKGMIKFIRNIKQVIKDNGPYQIVHSHTFYNSGIILLVANRLKIPIRISHIHTNHSFYKVGILKKIYNCIMKHYMNKYSTKKCACSKEAGIAGYGRKSFEKDGIIVNNCIDVKKYAFNEESRERIRKELGIKESDIVIGNVGRLSEVKNQEFLIEILHRINDENKKLIIVGEGTKRKYLEEKTKEYELQNKIIFMGNKKNINEILSAFDLFVLPSRNEGLGMVLLEAQANGLRCIASNTRVPKTVRLLNNFDFVNLEDDIKKWIQKIEETDKIPRINNATEILIKNGFDLTNFRNYINKLYT